MICGSRLQARHFELTKILASAQPVAFIYVAPGFAPVCEAPYYVPVMCTGAPRVPSRGEHRIPRFVLLISYLTRRMRVSRETRVHD